jgi:hypothetical protein
LLYIPDEYVIDNVNDTFAYDAADRVTYGKKDYALLVITGPTSNSITMPTAFPFLPVLQSGLVPVNSPVYLTGYAAEFLSYEELQRDLYQLTTQTSVAAQQPIGSSTVPEVLAFPGNLSAQHGASGGAVIALGGRLAGLITFLNKDYGTTTGDRIVSAISTDYILKDFKSDKGMDLFDFIAPADLISVYKKFMADNGTRYQQLYNDGIKSKGYWIPGVN